MSFLGIDVGTSGCKAAIFTEEGKLLRLAYEEYDYQRPQPGWAQLDTAQVWQQIKRTISSAGGGVKEDPVQALCVSSLGEAFVPVTDKREILGPSLLNFDIRGEGYLNDLQGAISDEDLYRINGNTIGTQFSVTKLKWLKQTQPDLYQQADKFLHWSGFVAFMLGAEAFIDYSLANRTLLFDLERRDWSEKMLRLAKIDREKLPPAVPSGRVIGAIGKDIAKELGLPTGIPIVSGAHDQCCNGIGCGVINPGRAMYGMGTYICVMPVFELRPEPSVMMSRGLNTEHHAVPGQYVSFIYNQGGVLVKWFRETFASAERQSARAAEKDLYTILMAEMPEDLSRVMVLPYFTITGPPRFISDLSGVMAGLKLETTRGEILKGILEATTFYIRECIEMLPGTGIAITDFRAVGGGSKSEAWLQICADILGRPIVRPKINEAGALGAAILSGTGSGAFSTIEDGVEAMVHLDRTFEPESSRQRIYDERYAKYQRLEPLLADYLRDLAA